MSLLTEALRSQWFETHQTFVASITAFAGIAIGWWATSTFNRRHADRLRHQDATSLAALLAAEIHAMRHQARMLVVIFKQLEGQVQKVERPPDSKFDGFRIGYVRPRIFEKVADKLGLLGPRLSFRVAGFYFLFFDVLGSIDVLPQENVTDRQVLQLVKSLDEGLKKVWDSGSSVLPELLAFTQSRRPPKPGLRWMLEEAAGLTAMVNAGESDFDPSIPFTNPKRRSSS